MDDKSIGIQQSKKYDDFTLLEANRLISRPHIQDLIKSFSETPDIARTHPILVNEKLEIIDGQHRFLAWKEMKWPVYYIVEKGLTVQDALRLNSNQRAWRIEDYARAYAMSGNTQYQQFLELREEFHWPYTILQIYCEGHERSNATKTFKQGHLKLMKDRKSMRDNMEKFNELIDLLPAKTPIRRTFAVAIFETFKAPTYNHEFFLEKFKLRGEHELTNFHGTKNDYLRAIENIYNYYTSPEDQIRLF